ncbi:MAG TPA: amidohydrolase family protein, partial [Pyrinomonadaceae bacterium]|nr:amidohydrolase family protein [Pyrinomonadaceae bacterium]
LRGTVFQEVFGPDARMAREQWAKSRALIDSLRAHETALVRVGISPHAPYTVSAPLLELATDYALAASLPMMMHAAESEAETLLIRDGRGPFAEDYARRGIEWHAPGVSPVQYLAQVGVLRARPLLAHCIRVDDADIETISTSGASVAHCPKSNAKLGHGHAPYHKFLHLRHGFGSDSVASNNTCDLLEEARTALITARAVAPEALSVLSAEQALADATDGGAHALDVAAQTGALVVGRAADLIAVRLDGAHQLPVHDPVGALVFTSAGRDVVFTLVAGREIYRAGRVLTVDEERLRARMQEIAARLTAD